MKFLTKDAIKEVLEQSVNAAKGLQSWCNEHNIDIQTKQRSEIFSKILESKCVSILPKYFNGNIICAKSDKDPDLLFDTTPLEIKVTSGDSWTGGEYSKRPSKYLLVSIDILNNEFFVALVNIKTEEWKLSKGNYYGTTYNKKMLLNNPTKRIIFGNIDYIYSTKNNKKIGIKIERETLK